MLLTSSPLPPIFATPTPSMGLGQSSERTAQQADSAHRPPFHGFRGIHRLCAVCGFRCWTSFLLFLLVLACLGQVRAGLTATEVIVVVNGQSLNSRTLANHYARLRQIPSINIVVLEGVPDAETISVADFREKILKPLLLEIEQRKLANHIQCITYSADFPTAIDISADLAELKDLNTVFTKVASINGLTYLYDLTQRSDPAYITTEANFYARRPMGVYFTNPGGKETEELWGEINVSQVAGEYAKAGELVSKLLEKAPYQYPLKYFAAALAAQAGDKERALKLLDDAIAAGWNSGVYLSKDPQFESLKENDEFQSLMDLLDQDGGKWQPTVPFNARSMWGSNGVEFAPNLKQTNLGMRYMLSTVLGVTRGLGTTLDEAIESLKRSKSADFTHPTGGFYFSSTLDIRTKTRQPNFALAVEELRKLGFDAEVVVTEYPKNQKVMGAQLGTPSMDWSKTGSKLLPGAIVDNLTSLGGVMTPPKSQTPLSHFIASGAAGSSGTVTEPYSVPFKFPSPMLYLHYAQGLSLAEAFYQSITGPYQLLIVGDPLCQPFSIAPNQPIDTSLRTVKLGSSIQFAPDLSGPSYADWLNMKQPPAKRATQIRATKVAIQIDGLAPLGGNIQPNVNVKMDRLALGYHEIQVVLIADEPLRQRSMQVIPVWIGDSDLISLSVGNSKEKAEPKVSLAKGKFQVLVNVPEGCSEVSIHHHHEQVATSKPEGTEVQIELDPKQLGMGPVRLQARAKLADGGSVASMPLWIEVLP